MKRFLSILLTMAIIFSAIGGLIINPETTYARMGVDIYGNPVDNANIYQPTDDPVYYYQPPVDENGNHDYFGYPIYGDPMDISDEEFFGKWDDLKQEWVLTPYFAYHNYPEMSKVEEAAKAGDYATAKVELKNYYSNYTGRAVPVYSLSAKASDYLDALSRNVFAYSYVAMTAIGGFEVPAEEWSKVEYDVLTEVNSAKTSSYPDFNIELASADKFWTTAQIYSKDAADPSVRPVLRMVVNGVVTERYPYKDTMVVAGTESGTNYGFDEIIDIQEHGTYDDIGEPHGNFDENTKRAFMCFDISDMKSTDTITSAKIIFTARSVITDETREKFSDDDGTPYSKPARAKTIWATWYRTSAWEEKDLTWGSDVIADKFYFSCNDMNAWDFITSQKTSIKGKVCDYHRYNQQGNLAKGYELYGDERYAYTCIRQDMALLNSIGDEPAVMNQLDNAVYMAGISTTPYYLIDSKYMTPEIFTAYLKFIWQLARTAEQRYFGVADNNWATFTTGGVYRVVAYYPEFLMHDYWYQRVLEENERCLSGFNFEDGHCVEVSQAYISTILDTFEGPMEAYHASGHGSPYTENLYQNIYNIVKNGIYAQGGPDGGGFGIADSNDNTDRTSMYKIWYQYLFSDDEEIAYMATGGAIGRLPENPTTHYPVALRTFMRSSWDGKKALQMSFVNTSDSRRSHAHDDCLSITMFAYGQRLLIDPGYGSDQTGDGGRVWDYNRSPVQHNLVTINDTYDYLTDGVCGFTQLELDSTWEKDFETNKSYDFVEYVCDGYSTAQTMQRSVTFLKNQKFWIVSDYAVPNNPDVENVFAQHWHMYPGAAPTNDANYVVRSNFDGANVLVVPLEYNEIEDIQYINGYYGDKGGQKILHPKAMLTKSHTGAGRFTTLIIPVAMGEDFEVVSTVLENNNDIDDSLLNMANFKITETSTGNTSYYCYYHINDASKKPKEGVKVSNYVTDATTMMLQFDEDMNMISVFITDGSYIKDTSIGEYLFETGESTTISYTKSGKFLKINSSLYDEAKDLEDLSIYMPNISAVRLEDKNVSVDIVDG
ncbi:MAG: heparinase II/III family protein, partial [Clostridia bacterium]|nr:heparinase II/III family protein [Clostridia bacterium]